MTPVRSTVLLNLLLRHRVVAIAAAIFGIAPSPASPADVRATSYAWIADLQSTNQVAGDRRFAAMVDATTPRYFSEVGSLFGSKKLSNQFGAALGGPPDDVQVSEHRYISLSACLPHNCGVKGFLWIDSSTKLSVGVVASGLLDEHLHWHANLLVFSRTVSCRSIPADFRRAVAAWVAHADLFVESTLFVDRQGAVKRDCY